MSKIWGKRRIKSSFIAPLAADYGVINLTEEQLIRKKDHPEIFKFQAISIGDRGGQLFFVPLDESSRKNAEYILRAIKAYKGE